MSERSDDGVPAGWTLALDPTVRRTDAGRVLVGGAPLRVLRLSAAGARLVERLASGDPVPASGGARRLARRLCDGGLAAPRPAGPPGFEPSAVAVVIPVRDDAVGLARTLATIGEVGEVVVVDDGSLDPDAVRRVGVGVTVVRHDRSLGPAAGRETGWRLAGRPVVAFVDAGVEVTPGWLPALLAHLDDPSVAAVAPRVMTPAVHDDAPAWLAAYESARSPLDRGPVAAPVRPGSRVTYVPTAALVVRRAALDAVGGLDPALRVGEDVDLVWRLHDAGWRVRYEPAVTVRHPSRSSLGAWLRQRFRYGTSAAPLAARHGDAVAPLGVSGWSALAWGLVLLGRPLVGVAVGASTTAALTPKLRGLEHPGVEAARIAGTGNLYAGRAVADALRRPWWPLALLLGALHRRSRSALLAAAVVPSLLEWRETRPPSPPAAYAVLRLLDDAAYGAGVWAGCLRARSWQALLPRFTGRFPRPTPELGVAPGHSDPELHPVGDGT